MSKFSAGSSALGYLYQAIQGLSLLINSESGTKMYIERYDDVEFEKDGTARELIQLKHKIKSASSLSNYSSDLWKSIRIWIEEYRSGKINLAHSIFTIMTTSSAEKDSAAFFLSEDRKQRDTTRAMQILEDVSSKSLNRENEAVYELFSKLSLDEKFKLVDNLKIIDELSNISETEQEILTQLKWSVRNEHLNSFYDSFQGWWFRLVIRHLSGESRSPIYYDEVDAKIHDLAEQYRAEDLTIDYRNLIPTLEQESNAKRMIFVKQLNLIALHEKRIKKAISDYYKAFSQRSKWVGDKLLFLSELEEYEERLVDEWERYFLIVTTKLSSSADKKELQIKGQEIFDWMDITANFCIREYCTEPYVMRGSYHMLADDRRVGWHPTFLDRLEELLGRDTISNGAKEKPTH